MVMSQLMSETVNEIQSNSVDPGKPGGISADSDSVAYASSLGRDSREVEEDAPSSPQEAATQETDKKAEADGKPTEENKASTDKEDIFISDDKGRRKITVDYSDRAKIKKAFELAAGMRKFQTERDQLKTSASELTKKVDVYKTRFEALEKAWNEPDGINAVIKLLSDGKKDLTSIVQERQQRANRRAKADPAELAAMDFEEQLVKEKAERLQLAQKFEELQGNVNKTAAETEVKRRESMVHPVFDKYSFEGKLGNDDDEYMLNEMMWTRAGRKLDEYETSGVPLSKELVEKEFKAQHVAISRVIKKQAEEKAASAVNKQRDNATQSAQTRVSQSMNSMTTSQKSAMDELNKGNLRGFFKRMGG